MCAAFSGSKNLSTTMRLCALHTLINTNWAIHKKENIHVNPTFLSFFRRGIDLMLCVSLVSLLFAASRARDGLRAALK